MNHTAGILLLAAWAAAAQTPPVRLPAGARPPAARQPAAKPARLDPEKDLKFPPLAEAALPVPVEFRLSNGMRALLVEDHSTPLIHGEARVAAGALFDPPEKAGLAALTAEAIRTGGAAGRTGAQRDAELEAMAARLDASASGESLQFSFSALKENSAAALALLAGALTAPEFGGDEVARAKAVAQAAIARRNEDASTVARRELVAALYGRQSPYGRRPEPATIAAITRADMQAFHRRYVFPANTLLLVWGDFAAADMKAQLEAAFANWKSDQPPPPPLPNPPTANEGAVWLAGLRGGDEASLAIGQLGTAPEPEDRATLDTLCALLRSAVQEGLGRRIATAPVAVDWSARRDFPGAFAILAPVHSVATQRAVTAALAEVERVRAGEVPEPELKAARDEALLRFLGSMDTPEKAAARLLDFAAAGLPTGYERRYQRALSAVTRQSLLRMAKQRLDPQRFAIVVAADPAGMGGGLESLGRPMQQVPMAIPPPPSFPATPEALALGRKLFDAARAATGGAAQLDAIRDFTAEYETFNVAQAGGGSTKAVDRWAAPTAFRMDQSQQTGGVSVFVDEGFGWVANQTASGPLSGADLRRVLGIRFRLYARLLSAGGTVALATAEDTVELRGAGGETAELVVDPATGMPRAVRYSSGAANTFDTQETWSDFRTVGGTQIPFSTAIFRNGVLIARVSISRCQINTGLTAEELRKRP